MKNMFYIFLVLLFCPAAALTCDFEKDFLGKTYDLLNSRFEINHELHKGKYFSQIIRNKNLKCKDLPEGEATMFFIDEKLARINIFSTSEKLDLLVFAKSKFGETENQLNEDSSNNKNYADYWDKKNIIITYKNTLSPQNIWQENLVIELKKFSSELYESENVKE